MVNPKNGWLHMVIQSAIISSVLAVIALGCASSPPSPSAGTDGMIQILGDVSIAREGDDSVIFLEGLIDPMYSVSAAEGSNLIIVDLVGVKQSEAASLTDQVSDEARQIATYDGVVDLVTLATFEEEGGTSLTRIEIVMAGEGRAELSAGGEGLEIRIILGAWDAAEMATTGESDSDSMTSEPWGEEGDFQETGIDSDADPSASDITISMTPPPDATKVMEISSETTESGVLVSIHADGAIATLEAFTLIDPPRLVIDLPGLTMAESLEDLSIDSRFVTGIRLGSHDGKVRVVIDGGADADDFQGRQIMPGTTGLWIAIGSGDELEQRITDALAESEAAWFVNVEPVADESLLAGDDTLDSAELAFESEETSEVAEATEYAAIEDASMATYELAEIYGLHYQQTGDLYRTAILADDSVQYTMTAPNETTIVISMPGSQIRDEASDRIFPKFGGPISLIHVFQQPDVEVPEVRVVFTRAPNQMPVVSRRGSMLFVDFEDMGVAAPAPPAFPNAGVADDSATMASANMMDETSRTPTMTELAELAMLSDDVGVAMDPSTTTAPADVSPMSAEMTEEISAVDLTMNQPSLEDDVAALTQPAPDASVWDAPAELATGPAAVEVPGAIEVLEEGGLIDGKEYRGRRVSLDFKDVEIADVLRLIAEVSDLNIIAGDEVAGSVTIRLVEVPWDQALDVILMTKGLGFIRVGNVLRIAPSEVLKAEEEVRLQERRNKEKLEDLEVKLLPVNYASVKDMSGLVKRLLSARGTVNVDVRTNTLIIKDISSVIDEATALITAIDTQTPQVMIEAKIVEANLDFSRELGSVWGIQTQQDVDPFNPGTPRTDLGSQDLRFIDNNSLIFSNPITSVPNGLVTLGALLLDQDFRIDAQIQAAESTGDGKVISSPRVVTLDNKQARIEQGVSIPFQTFEGGDAKLEFIDAVLSLVVTPHITADESIIMEIAVTRNAPDDSVSTPTGSPAIAKNVAETETLVKDGQTLVLGGIYTITKSRRQTRIPYLHRIPVIGNLFKNNEITDSRKELLIFVTPRIVRMPETASN